MNFIGMVTGMIPSIRAAKLSPEQANKNQQKKLRKILKYAYEHSEFYHKTFESSGITEENIDYAPIESFPTTDKNEIIDNYEQVLTHDNFTQEDLVAFDEAGTEGLFMGKYHVVHSSGSTGEPRFFVYDEDAWDSVVLAAARSALWNMPLGKIAALGLQKTRLLYVAVTGSSFGGPTMVSEACRLIGAEKLFLDVNEPLDTWIDKVVKFKPNFLFGYPSALKILTEQLKERNIRFPVKRILTCGESLTPGVRDFIEKWFNISVVNFYACTESLCLGVEDNLNDGMFLFDDVNYIEVIDGKMYLTSLYNFGQPIIRYYLSDSLEMMPRYQTGYTFSRCRIKTFRTEDVIWFTDQLGKRDFLHPVSLEDFCIRKLLGYQFVQTGRSAFRVDCETEPDAKLVLIEQDLRKQIQHVLDEHLLNFVTFDIKFVSKILPDPRTGKCRLCIAIAEGKGISA